MSGVKFSHLAAFATASELSNDDEPQAVRASRAAVIGMSFFITNHAIPLALR